MIERAEPLTNILVNGTKLNQYTKLNKVTLT